jgi:hypothetical protein
VQKNSVAPVEPTPWIVCVGSISNFGDVHISSRRFWANVFQALVMCTKVPEGSGQNVFQHRFNRRSKKGDGALVVY